MSKRGGLEEEKGAAHAGKRRRAIEEKTAQEEIMNQARREPSFGLVLSCPVLSDLESPNLLTPTFWALSNRSRPGAAVQKRDSVS
ncbi:unnamed protein product [Fusarium graminearum]|uniref:Uncharacterized protein n=1 Tax=Gibberella zeae TaxID=5518 RepID=A0A4U9F4C5_GIBZA|nr:unnamed protein product [Fusarium graminearum]CAF3456881.1 unnamed protein product [Fusarium graminearum]CAF3547824.1 unnamed protein product [Fusarium graminearum]CAG1964492.1 unnamed protein product [Fusarium graminearum]CAG1988344.1 unnamed protein product [Fusarium graminearum]